MRWLWDTKLNRGPQSLDRDQTMLIQQEGIVLIYFSYLLGCCSSASSLNGVTNWGTLLLRVCCFSTTTTSKAASETSSALSFFHLISGSRFDKAAHFAVTAHCLQFVTSSSGLEPKTSVLATSVKLVSYCSAVQY